MTTFLQVISFQQIGTSNITGSIIIIRIQNTISLLSLKIKDLENVEDLDNLVENLVEEDVNLESLREKIVGISLEVLDQSKTSLFSLEKIKNRGNVENLLEDLTENMVVNLVEKLVQNLV